MTDKPLSDADYRSLAEFRHALRRFLAFSEHAAREHGLTPSQHQLLLAIRGHADPRGPTVGDVAAYLLLRHHSVVGLVDRAELAGLIERRTDPKNHRVVRLHLTRRGALRLATLASSHLDELERLQRLNVPTFPL